uniref:Phosphodiesterase n=1 Tax=Pogona vitticeps TaxID=103695 RepID=A0ABM5F915_9SAUR
MTQDKRDKIGVRTNCSSAKSKTCDQKAKKKLSATLLGLLGTTDELSNIKWDSVPLDVQEWLIVTFARKREGYSYKPEEGKGIRTIAYAVQAGVFVERKFRTTTSPIGLAYPSEVIESLKDVDKWGFNTFTLNEASQGHSLKFMMCELFSKYDLLTLFKIPIPCLISFASALEVGYNKYQNPYHNAIHASDVTQTVHSILLHTGIMHWFTDLEILAIIFSTLIHDYEHTGTTNHFHVETRSETALLYNDRSVLENHHVSAAYHLLENEDMNILSNLTTDEWRELRRLVIEMVLATDMSHHFQQMSSIKHILERHQQLERAHKDKIMSMVVHAADVSHPAKPWTLHQRWAEALMEEFFQQGDKEAELGLPVSSLCDRKTTNIAASQIGFIDVIVKPIFVLLLDAVNEIVRPLIHEASKSRCASRRAQSTKTSKATDKEGASRESGTCTERQILSVLDIPRFKDNLLLIIQDNREKWKESQEVSRKVCRSTNSTQPQGPVITAQKRLANDTH